jgi:hypothetical protein
MPLRGGLSCHGVMISFPTWAVTSVWLVVFASSASAQVCKTGPKPYPATLMAEYEYAFTGGSTRIAGCDLPDG